MIKILFFAYTREMIGVNELVLPDQELSVMHLITELASRGDKWTQALKEQTVLCAVNKRLVTPNWIIKGGDEVAFFPPVTGG